VGTPIRLSLDIAADLHGSSEDLDGDGQSNLLEYQLGSSPVRPNGMNAGGTYKNVALATALATKAYDVYYRVVLGQQQDQYTSLEKHALYYAAPTAYDASYDPLKLTGTPAVRPVVTISQSAPNGFNHGACTIRRDVGSGSFANPLVIYFALGGNLVYRRDYVLMGPQGVTLNDASPPFSVTMPAGQGTVELSVVVTPGGMPASNLAVMLVPFGSVQ
jgi:hypothetical protein